MALRLNSFDTPVLDEYSVSRCSTIPDIKNLLQIGVTLQFFLAGASLTNVIISRNLTKSYIQ